jgi:Arc/MetJ family transcription regulator
MRTTIDIDDDVLREAQRLVGTRTKRDPVNLAADADFDRLADCTPLRIWTG